MIAEQVVDASFTSTLYQILTPNLCIPIWWFAMIYLYIYKEAALACGAAVTVAGRGKSYHPFFPLAAVCRYVRMYFVHPSVFILWLVPPKSDQTSGCSE